MGGELLPQAEELRSLRVWWLRRSVRWTGGSVNSHFFIFVRLLQKPANILVMGEGPERGRVKIGESDQRPINELRRQRLTFAGRRSDELGAPLHKER